MKQTYTVYSDFDLIKHKQTFINYLEVLILEDGSVKYAVPSHQILAENLCLDKLQIDRPTLYAQTRNHVGDYGDYMEYLLTICNAAAVWTEGIMTGYKGINAKQYNTLKRLKINGLYKGVLPRPTIAELT